MPPNITPEDVEIYYQREGPDWMVAQHVIHGLLCVYHAGYIRARHLRVVLRLEKAAWKEWSGSNWSFPIIPWWHALSERHKRRLEREFNNQMNMKWDLVKYIPIFFFQYPWTKQAFSHEDSKKEQMYHRLLTECLLNRTTNGDSCKKNMQENNKPMWTPIQLPHGWLHLQSIDWRERLHLIHHACGSTSPIR